MHTPARRADEDIGPYEKKGAGGRRATLCHFIFFEEPKTYEPDEIKSVDAHSPAQRAGVRPGETLTHINGRPIVDVLDYKFFAYDPRLELTLVGEDGRSRTLRVRRRRGRSWASILRPI